MRKALKIILPIVLVLIILVTAYWFFFLYRTDLTADWAESYGDKKLAAGNGSAAIKAYEYAYQLQPGDTALALKLAQAYRQDGNYTKTEFYLVQAIRQSANSPEAIDLYLALSSAYVEQDKLLDAQVMLDQIQNESLRSQLDAMRPAPPEVSPEGGSYNEYITVELSQVPSAACYMTTNGQFPSLRSDLYTEPVQLEGGETTVCAISVGENGLVSSAVYVGYTVAGVVEDVSLQDPVLNDYVQELLNKGGRTLQTDDLWGITELEVPEGVTEFSDLAYFTGLTKLTIHSTAVSDFSFLQAMPSLRILDLSKCSLSSEAMTIIGSATQLEELYISDCGLSNLSALSSLAGLKILELSDNSVNDLSPISGMSELEELYLCRNALTDLSSLSKLQKLRSLDVSYNSLTSVSPLSGCTALTELNISENKLTDIQTVGNLVNLKSFDASGNAIEDISMMNVCTKLEIFRMSNNNLVSIDALGDIATLTEINIDYNDVVSLPDFVDSCALVTFSGAHNFLEDIEGLGGLSSLNYVNLDYNNIRDISCLLDCINLIQVNVFGTYIDDASEFAEHSIVVNYDPT